eukprot:TRINITY_DN71771_c0_g1_i1.p1 TRINITY_DN71771_c0_g1~~TRINITY_DN71771_c0_g1_i1.p1  ORF type:complete len:1007 (+),score=140.58 TRINITY_DN71771_c0_g1_i1:71-3022(+)
MTKSHAAFHRLRSTHAIAFGPAKTTSSVRVQRSRTGGGSSSNGVLLGETGWEEFDRRLEVLQRIEALQTDSKRLDFDLEEVMEDVLPRKYKNREVRGTLLHYAIDKDSQDTDGLAENVSLVLRAGGNTSAWMTYTAFGTEARGLPMHLAASRGLVTAIQLLVDFCGEVNEKSEHGDTKHYCAIHDAAFSGQPLALAKLLELKADPNEKNKDMATPIHIVSKFAPHHATEMAGLLVKARAVLDEGMAGQPHQTPLMMAVQGRMFPKDHLHLLAPFCHSSSHTSGQNFFSIIMQVCEKSVPAAMALVSSIGGEERRDFVHNVWSTLTDDRDFSAIECMTKIIGLSPHLASAILHLFFMEPVASAMAHHPVPKVANLMSKMKFTSWEFAVTMFTSYNSETDWTFDTTCSDPSLQIPPWHRKLAPPPMGNSYDSEVQVRVVKFPNLLDVRLLHAINRVSEPHVYGSLPFQVLVNCAWQCVERAVVLNTVLEICVLIVLTLFCCATLDGLPIRPPSWPALDLEVVQGVEDMPVSLAELYRKASRLAASALWAAAFREFFNKSYFILMHLSWDFRGSSLFQLLHLGECSCVGLLGAFMVLYRFGGERSTVQLLFCMNVLARWSKLIVMLRCIRGMGEQILPIINSFLPMWNLLLFSLMVYFSFFFAFVSVRGNNSIQDIHNLVFFATWGSDTDAYSGLKELGSGMETRLLMQLCVVVFTICTLNLMIAIYGNVYAAYQAQAGVLFTQMRSLASEQYLLQPAWRYRFSHQQGGSDGHGGSQHLLPFRLAAGLALLWLLLTLCIDSVFLEPVFACLLAASGVLLQAALMQNSWANREFYLRRSRQDSVSGVGYSTVTDSDLGWGCMRLLPGRSRDMQKVSTQSDQELVEEQLDYYLWVCYADGLTENMRQRDEDDWRETLTKLSRSVDNLYSRIDKVDGSLEQLKEQMRLEKEQRGKERQDRQDRREGLGSRRGGRASVFSSDMSEGTLKT